MWWTVPYRNLLGVYKAEAKTDAIDTMEDVEGLGHVQACRETKRYAEATVRI
jgi:hypothetical protein